MTAPSQNLSRTGKHCFSKTQDTTGLQNKNFRGKKSRCYKNLGGGFRDGFFFLKTLLRNLAYLLVVKYKPRYQQS